MKPTGAGAVMAQRREPPDSLDFFPTPPWATRALCEHVLPQLDIAGGDTLLGKVWESACGRGHMAEPLAEYSSEVFATDVFDYGFGEVLDFLDPATEELGFDWIVTNPPFNVALAFALKAMPLALDGLALLCRTSWLEGRDRYERLFRPHPPTAIAHFVERVPMVKGRWDPNASSATSYSWFVWTRLGSVRRLTPATLWIPPGCREALTRSDDIRRFAPAAEIPLFGE